MCELSNTSMRPGAAARPKNFASASMYSAPLAAPAMLSPRRARPFFTTVSSATLRAPRRGISTDTLEPLRPLRSSAISGSSPILVRMSFGISFSA